MCVTLDKHGQPKVCVNGNLVFVVSEQSQHKTVKAIHRRKKSNISSEHQVCIVLYVHVLLCVWFSFKVGLLKLNKFQLTETADDVEPLQTYSVTKMHWHL